MYTNALNIAEDTFQLGIIDLPDKYSYREEIRRRNGYLLRLYWQFQDTLRDGCVIFDTLTYSDKYLPHICDFADFGQNFSCFNPDDYKSWIDRLRSKLSYDRVDVPFKVFFTSEYGGTDSYVDHRGRIRKATHRPHYHVLFFFEKKVDPFYFAKAVHQTWKKGRTDQYGNAGEVSKSEVLYNYFTSDNCSHDRIIRLSNYLSKYVLKDAKYCKKVDRVVYDYVRSKCPNKYLMDKKAFNHDCNRLRSLIAPFIRISEHFGDYFLDPNVCEMDLIYEKSMMRLPDAKHIWKYIPIPTYYLRKLFYSLHHGQWQLTEKGKHYYKYHLKNRCQRLSSLYTTTYINLPDSDRVRVDRLLDGRSIDDLSVYVTYYRNRIFNPVMLDDMPSKDFIIGRIISDPGRVIPNDLQFTFYTYSRYEYRTRYEWIYDFETNDPKYMSSYLDYVLVRHKHYDHYDDWRKNWIIDDSWFPDYYDFEEVLQILHGNIFADHIIGQETYDFKKQLSLDLFNNLNVKSDF